MSCVFLNSIFRFWAIVSHLLRYDSKTSCVHNLKVDIIYLYSTKKLFFCFFFFFQWYLITLVFYLQVVCSIFPNFFHGFSCSVNYIAISGYISMCFLFRCFQPKNFSSQCRRSHRPDPAVARAAFFARSCWSWTLGTPWCAWRPSKRSWRRRSGAAEGLGEVERCRRCRKWKQRLGELRVEVGDTW